MQVAASYAADQLALLLNGGSAPAWFAAETAATIVDGDTVTAFQGNAAGYVAAASAALGTGSVSVSNIAAAAGVAGSILVTVTGTIAAEAGAIRGFSLTSNLNESDAASTMYTVSETLVLSEAIASEAVPAPATTTEVAAEEPAAAAAAAPVEEPVAADVETAEVAEATAEAEAPQEREETPTPPSPPSSPAAAPAKEDAPKAAKEAPKATAAKAETKAAAPASKPAPKGWAAIAAANNDQKMKPAPVVKPATPQPEPEAAPAPVAKPVAAPKRKLLQQVTFKVLSEVSDDDIRAALPETLIGDILLLRNKSAEPTTQRVWIDFAVADAVTKLNAAKITLAGKTVVAEEARKKPVQPK